MSGVQGRSDPTPGRCRPGRADRRPILLAALALDLVLGEPPNRLHPVAGLGGAAARLEAVAPRRGRVRRLGYGAAMTALLVGGSAVAGQAAERASVDWPTWPRVVLLAATLKASLSLRALAGAANSVASSLDNGDLPGARAALRALVSRPTAELAEAAVASAAVESVAENLADSVVAPILAYLALGLPGALAYRAANMLDAMIGYHGDYEELGKAAARLDDLANLAPARLSAALLVAAAALGLGDAGAALATVRRDHGRTESPNAGWPMSAAAGALRVRLEKRGHYVLGAGFREPVAEDIRRAVRLCSAAALLGAGLAALATDCPSRWRPRPTAGLLRGKAHSHARRE